MQEDLDTSSNIIIEDEYPFIDMLTGLILRYPENCISRKTAEQISKHLDYKLAIDINSYVGLNHQCAQYLSLPSLADNMIQAFVESGDEDEYRVEVSALMSKLGRSHHQSVHEFMYELLPDLVEDDAFVTRTKRISAQIVMTTAITLSRHIKLTQVNNLSITDQVKDEIKDLFYRVINVGSIKAQNSGMQDSQQRFQYSALMYNVPNDYCTGVLQRLLDNEILDLPRNNLEELVTFANELPSSYARWREEVVEK